MNLRVCHHELTSRIVDFALATNSFVASASIRPTHAGNKTKSSIWVFLCTYTVLAFAGGCVHPTIGPKSLPRDRGWYSYSLAESWKEQTLLNIVKVRYVDPPVFVDIGSIVASYSLIQSASAGGNIVPNGTSSVPVGVTGTFSNSPTITYTPLTGNTYINGLLTPLSPTIVFAAIQNGAPADSVLLTSLSSINGLKNQEATWYGIAPADPAFRRVLVLLHQIHTSGAIREYIRKMDPSPQQNCVLAFRTQDVSPEIRAAIDEFRALLHLNPEATEFTLSYGPAQSTDTEIAVVTRSIIGLIINMAAEVEVPPDDVAQHRAFPGFDSNRDTPGIIPIIHIHSSSAKPTNEFVETFYRNTWFWIDDGDLDSKRAFTQLLQLFAMADTGPRPENLPVVTIPAH